MPSEAPMERREGGLKPTGDGWFVVNARDTEWMYSEKFGGGATFEGKPGFAHYGINVQVLWPGQPNGYYHSEDGQEDFLILSGECLLLIEGEERRLKAWDFVHCPPGTDHIFVGAGDGPCAFLAVGARNAGDGIVYTVSELAQKHEAGVTEETTDPKQAYAGTGEIIAGPYRGGLPGD
jgi:uncharacterized cupin superfamily protein